MENGVLTVPDPPETTDLTLTKVWDDDSNRDGKRFSVTFALYKTVNGTTSLVKDGISLTADNDSDKSTADTWTVIMKDLPAYEDGKAVMYTVKETSSLTGTGYAKIENGLTVTNTRSTDTVDITVSKIWDDADHVANKKDYVRPDVVLSLYGQTASENEPIFVCDLTLTEADADSSDSSKWSVTKTGLPMYRGGKKITYTVTEETIPGYKAPVIDGLTATNTPLDRVDDLLPVTATLRKVDAKVKNSSGLSGAAFKLEKKDSSGSWVLVKDNIVTGHDGTVMIEFTSDGEYRLTETAAPVGYVLTSPAPAYSLTVERKLISIELNGAKTAWVWKYDLTVHSDNLKDGILTIPNGADTAVITLTKVWKDNSNKRGKRFSGVTFDLYKTVNGVTTLVKEGISLTAENDTDPETADIWTVDVLNMPLYEDGYMVVYTVTETTPLEDTDYKKAEDGLTVTNTYVHSPLPPTGDDTNVTCRIIITAFSLMGIGVSILLLKRRYHKVTF